MLSHPNDLPRAHEINLQQAQFRLKPDDFKVEEELGFELSGEGEHLWLLVEKKGLNTMDVTKSLAAVTGLKLRDIGYAGLKDKHAVTKQWFSLRSDKALAEKILEKLDKIHIHQQVRNSRKLRQGSHRGNRFVITLRDIELSDQFLAKISDLLRTKGVPNFFGPQRFGHSGRNLEKAEALFSGKLSRYSRFQKGIYLSAARAFLFNSVLARRVSECNWDQHLPGDVMALAGSASVFKSESGDIAIPKRLSNLDIHPTGPLWGKGELDSMDLVKKLEHAISEQYSLLVTGLTAAGLKQERRPLRVVPENLQITPDGADKLVLEFSLPKGAFATSVIREMVKAPGL